MKLALFMAIYSRNLQSAEWNENTASMLTFCQNHDIDDNGHTDLKTFRAMDIG